MPNEKHKCAISKEELIHDNINDFILVKVSNTEIERATHAHYFIHSSIQNVFFGLEKCPLTRATEEYQALHLKDLSAKLKQQAIDLTDNAEFNFFLANEELKEHIKTGCFKFKTIATNPATALDEFKNLLASYPLQMHAIIDTENNESLLHYFANKNKTEFVEALITAGVSINNTDLHEAAKNGETEKVISLITGGADINVKNSCDRTPLQLAAANGHTETANALITAGADIEAKDFCGCTPLHLAAGHGQTETITALVDKGADIDAEDNNGFTPLYMAAYSGQTETAQALINKGAEKEAKDSNDKTPLHWAAQQGQTETANALITAGANKEAKDFCGFTPLHLAAANGHTETANALITAGADIEAKDIGGCTPLHLAAILGHKDAATALIDAGANKEAKDKYCWTPLHLAAQKGQTETVQALINQGASVKGGWVILLGATLVGETTAVKTVIAAKISNIHIKEIIPYLMFVSALLLAAHFVPQVFLFLTGSLLGYLGLIQNLPVIQAAILSLLSIPLLDYLYQRMTTKQGGGNGFGTGESPLESSQLVDAKKNTNANTGERRVTGAAEVSKAADAAKDSRVDIEAPAINNGEI